MSRNKIITIKVLCSIIVGLLFGYLLNPFFTKEGIASISNIMFEDGSSLDTLKELIRECLNIKLFNIVVIERIEILTIAFSYISAHFIFGPRKTFRFFFKYRWIVGGILLLFLVISRYNGDSMEAFEFIQHDKGTVYENPIIGFETPERSDETIVSTPRRFWYYNNGLPGTDFNIASVLRNPIIILCELLLYTVGVDYAISLEWYFYVILAVLLSIEFFMIITERHKLFSLAATMMIYCSTFYLWWIFPTQLINSMGVIVSFYYCLKAKRDLHRVLLGISTAIFSIKYVFSLYPAWQVPTAYLILALMIWVVVDRFADIKGYKKREWLEIGACIAFMLVGMLICYFDQLAYISSVSATVYPGERVEYGSYTLAKLFNYIPAALFWLKRPGHMSENGIIISFFPLPILLSVYYLIKSKKKDIMLFLVSLATLLLMLYCSNEGLSQSIAKLTLLSHSTAHRAADIVAYAQVILLARVVGIYRVKNEDEEWNNVWFKRITLLVCGVVFALYSIHIARINFGEYMPQTYIYIWICILTVVAYCLFSNMSYKKYICLSLVLISVSLFTGFIIRPIRKGTDVLYNKPVSEKLLEIKENEEDTVWIAYGSLTSQAYLKALGFDVINFVNITPNMELWQKLDPEGVYNEVYNRYTHVIVDFTDEDTSFELMQTDAMYLHLSYKDIEKTESDYIFSQGELYVDSEYIDLENVYDYDGVYIYKIIYK